MSVQDRTIPRGYKQKRKCNQLASDLPDSVFGTRMTILPALLTTLCQLNKAPLQMGASNHSGRRRNDLEILPRIRLLALVITQPKGRNHNDKDVDLQRLNQKRAEHCHRPGSWLLVCDLSNNFILLPRHWGFGVLGLLLPSCARRYGVASTMP